jgi:branched-chain amino acid transport system substrate-binding protein
MAAKPPDAFLSYARFDDRHDGGAISEFCRRLASAVQAVTGAPFNIFQDVEGIGIGEHWPGKLDQMLDETRFFIPILTPSYFTSKACRDELLKFLSAEARRGRKDLVLPIYYIECDRLEDEDLRAGDPLASIIRERQHQDWRERRFEPFEAPAVRRALEQLAREIVRARRRPASAPAPQAVADIGQARIVIATAGPMTGQYAVFGEQMKRGAEMAIKDLNAKGGVLGEQLRLEIGDDTCDPRQAVAVANQFVNKGVVFVAGHFCSGSSIPASVVYHEEGILQISPASPHPMLTEQGFDNVFRVCGRDDQQGQVAADYVVDNNVGSTIAVLHDNTAYGKELADTFKRQLNARGVQEVMYEAITAGDKDFTALITKMKNAGIDLIYLGGYHTEAGLITCQAHEQGLSAQMISGDALVTDEYWAITGDTGQGTLMTFSPDPRKNEAAAPVVAEFQAQGYDPMGCTLYTYAAIQTWAQAVEKAGSTDFEPVEQALHETQFETVLGTIGFDDKGDVKGASYVMYKWDNGSYAEVSG